MLIERHVHKRWLSELSVLSVQYEVSVLLYGLSHQSLSLSLSLWL